MKIQLDFDNELSKCNSDQKSELDSKLSSNFSSELTMKPLINFKRLTRVCIETDESIIYLNVKKIKLI